MLCCMPWPCLVLVATVDICIAPAQLVGRSWAWRVTVSFFFFFSSRRRHTRCLSDWSSDVCSSDLASAWGPTGHRAVGRIAERHLTPEAVQRVAELLAPEELAYVTTWADDIRSEPDWAKADAWHWVTIPDGQSYDRTPKNTAGDILEATFRFEKVLGDRNAPRTERVQALKWLAHLVGDLHQPLHAGRGDDHGGNDISCCGSASPATCTPCGTAS